MPHECLEELVGILFLNEEARRIDDVSRILHEFAAFWRELFQRHWRVTADVCQKLEYLLIIGETTLSQRLYDAVESNLCQCR